MTATLWLSRCPTGGASRLSRARVVCDAISTAADDTRASSVRASFFSAVGALNTAFLSSSHESSLAVCDPESNEPVPLPGDQASVSFGTTFGSCGAGYITCEVLDADVGSLARTVSVLTVTLNGECEEKEAPCCRCFIRAPVCPCAVPAADCITHALATLSRRGANRTVWHLPICPPRPIARFDCGAAFGGVQWQLHQQRWDEFEQR